MQQSGAAHIDALDARALDSIFFDVELFGECEGNTRSGATHGLLNSGDDDELVPLVDLVSSDDAPSPSTRALDSSDDITAAWSSTLTSLLEHVHTDDNSALQLPQQPTLPSSSLNTKPLRRNSSTSSSNSGKLTKLQPNKARNERKGELIYLRRTVCDLETRLRSLQANESRVTALPTAEQPCKQQQPPRVQPGASVPTAATVWQDIASHQREERIKAERENIRLKLVLENQLKVAKSLEKVLYKRSTTKDVAQFAVCCHHESARATADADVFADLLRAVERMGVDIDAVFAANGLAATDAPLRHAHVRADAQRGVSLELLANKVLPFDVAATADAVWHHFAFGKHRTPCRGYTHHSSEHVRSCADTVAERFVLTLSVKGTVAHFRVQQILRRRFVTNDRVVIVWRAAVEAVEFSHEPVANVQFYENGYIMIKNPQQAAATHALLQTCYIYTPSPMAHSTNGSNSSSNSESPRVGAITDFLMAATAANISSTHQMIENVLLEQALERRRSVETL